MPSVPRVMPWLILALLAGAAAAQKGATAEAEVAVEESGAYYQVIVDALKVRSEPNTTSETLGMLHLGDVIYVEEVRDGWVKSYRMDLDDFGWSCIEKGGETFLRPIDWSDNLLSFQLNSAGGEPIADAVLVLSDGYSSYSTDSTGYVSHWGLPAGTWDLLVRRGGREERLTGAVVSALPAESHLNEQTFTLTDGARLTVTVEVPDGIAKPNIYLYPIEETQVTVELAWPDGRLTASEPSYGTGWDVRVTPEGRIDGSWNYLFYEGEGLFEGQTEAGWCVERELLADFFWDNLAAVGFYPAEIEDFVEYWVPRLQDSPYYAVYPQFNDRYAEFVKLDVTPEPWTVIRLAYLLRPLDGPLEISPAEIPAYEVGGFTVHEWGVIIEEGDGYRLH